jgi:hypothetical protein
MFKYLEIQSGTEFSFQVLQPHCARNCARLIINNYVIADIRNTL